MSQSHNTQTTISILLALAVVMSGIHSKDIAVPLTGDTLKKADDTQQVVKITPELHHHNDSAVKIHPTGDGYQTDTRSLRLLHRHKTQPINHRLSDRLRNWLQLTVA